VREKEQTPAISPAMLTASVSIGFFHNFPGADGKQLWIIGKG
jgi:hypothetical protein